MHWMMFLTEDFTDLTAYQEWKIYQRMQLFTAQAGEVTTNALHGIYMEIILQASVNSYNFHILLLPGKKK